MGKLLMFLLAPNCLVTVWVAAFTVAVFALPAAAQQGRTVLTLSGKMDPKYAGGLALDMAALQRLPQKTITLKRSWEQKPTTFTGPLLRELLASVKAQGATIKARSEDDTETLMAADFVGNVDVIVAFKGTDSLAWSQSNAPLFLVYPSLGDGSAGYRIPAKGTFQLKSLTVE